MRSYSIDQLKTHLHARSANSIHTNCWFVKQNISCAMCNVPPHTDRNTTALSHDSIVHTLILY